MSCCCVGTCCGWLGQNACLLSSATVAPNASLPQNPNNGGGVSSLQNILSTVGTYGTALTAALSGKGAVVQTQSGTVTVGATQAQAISSNGKVIIVIAIILAAVLLLASYK